LTFRSPSELCCTDAVTGKVAFPATASLAVASPSTFSRCRVATHSGGDQPPDTCPLNVSHVLRALLHPVPAGLVSCRSRPWGSTLQGRSPPAEPSILSDVFALLGLTWLRLPSRPPWLPRIPGVPLVAMAILSRRRRCLRHAPLQGLAPCECLFLRADCLSRPGATTLLGFVLPGDFSPSAGDPPGVHPLSGFPFDAYTKPKVAPQSLRPAAGSAWLSRARCPLRGSVTLSSLHDLCYAHDPGLPLGDRWPLPACCISSSGRLLRCRSSRGLPLR
jgi:hypothetical protein